MTVTNPDRTSASAAVEGDLTVIEQSLDHIKRVTADAAMRAANATQAGATFAYDVEPVHGPPRRELHRLRDGRPVNCPDPQGRCQCMPVPWWRRLLWKLIWGH